MISRTFPGKAESNRSVAERMAAVLPWHRLALLGILAVALALNCYRLTRLGYANSYYAAGVRSMLTSWHNFYFASFDPGGFVSIDKPPLGLWVQAASAKLFGFSGLSLLLPQALAAVASVGVLYLLVRRAFGVPAGLIAALALALTPISVATARNNTADHLLVLVLLLAAVAVVRATETGRLRWLLLGMALVGLGFNIKMLQAYLVLPALGLLYLVSAPPSLPRRLLHLTAAGGVLAAVSLAWAVTVDLTPAEQRPYVGSSESNSVIDLALGYNGINRLLGNRFGGSGNRADGGAPAQAGGQTAAASTAPRVDGGPGGSGETGEKGWLRLFNQQLGGQISWLLPLAGLGAIAWGRRPSFERRALRLGLDRPQQSVLLWGVWLLTGAAFFSVAGFFHRYYLVMLGPPIAALAGAGVAAMWQQYRAQGWRGWLLPAALLVTAAVQAYLLRDYAEWRGRLVPPILALTGVVALVLVAARFNRRLRTSLRPLLLVAVGAPALLLAPAVWSTVTVRDGASSGLPAAGPSQAGGFGARDGGPPGGAAPAGATGRNDIGNTNSALIEYLQANRGDAQYLVATQSSMQASPFIIQTGEAVMAMGGFSGRDPILTADELAALVQDGVVRFFLAGGGPSRGFAGIPDDGPTMRTGTGDAPAQAPPAGASQQGGAQPAAPIDAGATARFQGPIGGTGAAMSWVTQNCTAVPAEAIGGASSGLYDCAAARG